MLRTIPPRALLAAALFLVACSRRDSVVPFQLPTARSGQLTATSDGLRFVPCGEPGPGVPLTDTPDGAAAAALAALGAGPGGATVLLRTVGAQVRSVRYAAVEGPPCSQLPVTAVAEAHGTEPFWSLRVEPAGPTLRTPDTPGGSRYPAGTWSRPDSTHWRYRARWRTDAAADSLQLDLTEEPCADGMSGARYPFRAALMVGGRSFAGCAIEGRAAMSDSADHRRESILPWQGTRWRLSRMGNETMPPGAELVFRADGHAFGQGYCNRFFGPVEVNGSAIHIGPLASTRKACAAPELQAREEAYFRALESAERFAGDSSELLVYPRGSTQPLRFEPGPR